MPANRSNNVKRPQAAARSADVPGLLDSPWLTDQILRKQPTAPADDSWLEQAPKGGAQFDPAGGLFSTTNRPSRPWEGPLAPRTPALRSPIIDPQWGGVPYRSGRGPYRPSREEQVAKPEPVSTLGGLSMTYETGLRPGQEGQAAATVSDGTNDPHGGPSYGPYQFRSKGGDVARFIEGAGARWANRFSGQDPTVPHGGFGAAWAAVAKEDPTDFFNAQHKYTEEKYYSPVVAKVFHDTGLDVNSRSSALQDVVWSMAVQHGAAPSLVKDAVRSLQGSVSPDDPNYDRELINRLYEGRVRYVTGPKVRQPGLVRRYKDEQDQALNMLGR